MWLSDVLKVRNVPTMGYFTENVRWISMFLYVKINEAWKIQFIGGDSLNIAKFEILECNVTNRSVKL